jgi:hypothetical protein
LIFRGALNLLGGDTNLYQYVSNSPNLFIDPSGLIRNLSFEIEFGGTIAPNPYVVGGFGSGGFSVGFNTLGQFYYKDRISYGFALGPYIGLGLSGSIGVNSSELQKGWSESTAVRFEGNAGFGKAVGTSFEYSPDGSLSLPKDLPKRFGGSLNWGYGIMGGLGVSKIRTYAFNTPLTTLINFYNKLTGGTWNDPHLQTLDSVGYDFQAVGEFTLVKSTTDDFEIQTRHQPWGSSTSASANSAIAIKAGGQRIALYANQTNPLLINGTAVTLPEGGLYAVGQNLITRQGGQYQIFTASNDLIQVNNRGTWLNINIGLGDNRKGKVIGLLGNFNDNRNDDFALRDGTVIGGTISDTRLYGDYAASWRITQANSLFTYASGQSTTTFTDLTFPRNIITTASLTPEQRAAAEQTARNAGITDPDVLEDIILDIFLSNGNTSFIQEAINGATNQQRIETVNSTNTLVNPDGLGPQHFLVKSAVIPYVIRFSNNAAPGTTSVALVTISQTLDADLDLNTLSLDDISFGAITLNVPNGSQNFSQRLDLRNTRNVFIDVNAGLNIATRVLTWSFTAIDPETGNEASASLGFLPVNDSSGAGQGFVGYSIQPKATSATNSRIDAKASIAFNGAAPIQTTAVFNTLDAEAPSSQVSVLPSVSEPTFSVSWTGADQGSGIAFYDIYVRVDNGSFALWQDDVTTTSEIYTGQIGKTYSFYSVATDRLGLREDAPSQPDATTLTAYPTITLAVSYGNSVGEDGSNNLVYTFSRSEPRTSALTVNYTLAGSATLGTDYTGIAATPATKTITFAAGVATATLTVDPTADTTIEPDETVALTLAAGTGYTIGTTAAVVGTILDDDQIVSLAVAPASSSEDGSGNLIYTFSRNANGALNRALTVNYTLAGSATLGTDYTGIAATPATKTITFAAGVATATLTVDPTADTTIEPYETVALTLAAGTGYTIGTTAAVVGTITNDDFIGTATSDVLIGTAAADYIDGLAGADTLTGNAGADRFAFRFSHSSLTAPDRITDFAFGTDKIVLVSPSGSPLPLPTAFSRAADNASATILLQLATTAFTDANGALANNQPLAADAATLVRATNPAIAGTYLLINDNIAALNSSNDLLINLTGHSGTLPSLGTIAPNLAFV